MPYDAKNERYARQLLLKEVGEAGQERLASASVLVIGAGGLGSPALLYLAAAGVGRIGIVEDDVVDLSNLNRQILYTSADVGKPKVQVAAERLRQLNPDLQIDVYQQRFAMPAAVELARDYDVLIDASDNFETRNLANEAAVAAGRPLVHGSVRQFEGQAAVFNYRGGPCYRCLFPSTPSQSSEADRAIIGPVAGLIGTIMATEALKIILQIGEVLSGRLLLYDALQMEFRTLRVQKNPSCPVCGGHS